MRVGLKMGHTARSHRVIIIFMNFPRATICDFGVSPLLDKIVSFHVIYRVQPASASFAEETPLLQLAALWRRKGKDVGGDKSTEHLEKTELPKFHVEISTGL